MIMIYSGKLRLEPSPQFSDGCSTGVTLARMFHVQHEIHSQVNRYLLIFSNCTCTSIFDHELTGRFVLNSIHSRMIQLKLLWLIPKVHVGLQIQIRRMIH